MLTMDGRRGFTLVEIMLAMSAMLLVGGALSQLLITTQRLSRVQAEQLGAQANVRGAVLAVMNELRESATAEGKDGVQNDILSAAPTALTYRSMRGTGFSCQPATPADIRIARSSFSGHRDPQAGRDSALVYLASAPESVSAWAPVAITAVGTAAECPGGSEAITLSVEPTAALAGAAVGTPVRLYEIMEIRLYQSEGKSWLGMRSVSAGEAIQPLFGPLPEGDGFRLDYFGSDGTPTSDPTAIKSIGVAVESMNQASSSFALAGRLALRNASR